jgi:hypothetical protein
MAARALSEPIEKRADADTFPSDELGATAKR